ncbi:hypothetical protein WJX81_006538 [Elliptochloris bilobata]|uniref:Uncharacterized protein n=1 Tax=Elliptochloris bilobata TaxID=381761 RepID=A0AAW1RBJ4_9CHLO
MGGGTDSGHDGATTKTGAPREQFGHGHEARVEAGKKGGHISAERPEEARKEAARKAARTRADRYGEELHVSDPAVDDLQGVPTDVHGSQPPAEEIHHTPAEGTTKTGAPKEHFGHGHEARVEAGKKGGHISAERSEEARKEAARKAARTRAERYGEELKVSDPDQDELQGVKTTKA